MRKTAFAAAFVLAAVLTISAQTSAPAIRHVLDASAAAWNRGDIPGFMQSYWQSPQTEFVGAGGVTRGWATVRDHYLHSYPDQAAMGHLAFTDIQITPLCADAALATGEFHLTTNMHEQHGYFTLVFRKLGGSWRIISDHTTAAR